MAKLLRLLARSGLTLTNPFYPQQHYRRPRVGDAAKDFIVIARDMRTISRDLHKVADAELKAHVQSAN